MDSPTGLNREQRRAQMRGRGRRAAGAALTASTVALGATSLLLAGGAAPAGAATFEVSNTDDFGPGSLRQAIIDANNSAGADVITFDPSVFNASSPQTITLESDLDTVEDDVDIQGPGASVLTVDANGFNAFSFDFASSSISGLTITGGDSTGEFGDDSGGGIALYGGSLDVSSVVVTGNVADNDGGGVWCNSGDSSDEAVITITDSLISGNESGSGGGGFYGGDCDATITTTTISGNTAEFAGGAYMGGGVLTIIDTTISGNTAAGTGGGVTLAGSRGEIDNSTISGNVAADGGAMYVAYSGAVVNQSTITQNQETDGSVGGILIDDRERAGAASEVHAGRVRASAIIDQVILSGAIVAGNEGADIGVIGDATAQNSIIGSITGTAYTDNGGNQLGVDPLLGPLANNGGPTQTHELLTGSPAIDRGPVPVATFPLNGNDQRGTGFLRVVNGQADVGAFEVQAIIPSPAVVQPRFTG